MSGHTTIATRRPMDSQATGFMLLFCLVLGLQQVAIKAVADDISPLAQIAVRSSLSALIVAGVARCRGIALWVPGQVGPGLAVGVGFTLEFAFVALGLNYTLASHMAVFLYTSPVFAAIGLHLFVPGERLAAPHWAGVALAFAGLIVALAPRAGVSADILLGDILGVAAGASWAATTLVLRTTDLSEAPPVRVLFYQLASAGLVLVVAATWLGDWQTLTMTPRAWASLSFQTLAVSVAALLLWFWLLRRYLASRLGIFSFLSPIFGVLFGAVLLGDPLSMNFLLGGLAIIGGMVLVSR